MCFDIVAAGHVKLAALSAWTAVIMAGHHSQAMRECHWCRKDIGVRARVCPYCFKGQGKWLLITAMPTWITAVIAVVAAVVTVAHSRFVEPQDQRVDRSTEQIVLSVRDVQTIVANALDERRTAAERLPPSNHAVEPAPADTTEMTEIMTLLTRVERSTTAAAAAVSRLGRSQRDTEGRLTRIKDDLDRYRDVAVNREINEKIERIDQGFLDAKTACLDESPECDASRSAVLTVFGSLTADVDTFGSAVSEGSRESLIQRTCAKGRLIEDWSRGAPDFAWYRRHCV